MAYRDFDTEIEACRKRIANLNKWLEEHGAEKREYAEKFKDRHQELKNLNDLIASKNKQQNQF